MNLELTIYEADNTDPEVRRLSNFKKERVSKVDLSYEA